MGEWHVSENCTLVKEGSEACLKTCIRCHNHSMGMIDRIMRWQLTSPMSLGMLIDWNSATFHNQDSSAQTGRIWHHPSAMCSNTGSLGTWFDTWGRRKNPRWGVCNFPFLPCTFFSPSRLHSPRYWWGHRHLHLQSQSHPPHFPRCSLDYMVPQTLCHFHHQLRPFLHIPWSPRWILIWAWGKNDSRKLMFSFVSLRGKSVHWLGGIVAPNACISRTNWWRTVGKCRQIIDIRSVSLV